MCSTTLSTAYLAQMRFSRPQCPQFTSITNETKFSYGHPPHSQSLQKLYSRNFRRRRLGRGSCIFMRICKHFLATRSAKIPWLNYFGLTRPQLSAQLKKFANPKYVYIMLIRGTYIYLSHNGVIIHNFARNWA